MINIQKRLENKFTMFTLFTLFLTIQFGNTIAMRSHGGGFRASQSEEHTSFLSNLFAVDKEMGVDEIERPTYILTNKTGRTVTINIYYVRRLPSFATELITRIGLRRDQTASFIEPDPKFGWTRRILISIDSLPNELTKEEYHKIGDNKFTKTLAIESPKYDIIEVDGKFKLTKNSKNDLTTEESLTKKGKSHKEGFDLKELDIEVVS